MNWIGVVAAIATFLGVWIGHVTVRKVEYVTGDIRIPAIVAVIIGLTLEIAALSSDSLLVSGALGILGMTALFDAFEFRRQHQRVKQGHAPANPKNPRHAQLLAEGHATTVDWLKRDPIGREVNAGEALELLRKGQPI